MSDKHNLPAVVLLSGGMDSATCLAIAIEQGYECHTIAFDYGQRHRHELKAAEEVAERMGVMHHQVIRLDPAFFGGGSALTFGADVPVGRTPADMLDGIPPTYVPARNTIFLAHALAAAERLAASDIFIGANAQDYAGYPDCRPAYYTAFEQVAQLGTFAVGRMVIHAPLVQSSKTEILRAGLDLGVPFEVTSSCYQPDRKGRACGVCDACTLRLQAFAEIPLVDPAPYQKGVRT